MKRTRRAPVRTCILDGRVVRQSACESPYSGLYVDSSQFHRSELLISELFEDPFERKGSLIRRRATHRIVMLTWYSHGDLSADEYNSRPVVRYNVSSGNVGQPWSAFSFSLPTKFTFHADPRGAIDYVRDTRDVKRRDNIICDERPFDLQPCYDEQPGDAYWVDVSQSALEEAFDYLPNDVTSGFIGVCNRNVEVLKRFDRGTIKVVSLVDESCSTMAHARIFKKTKTRKQRGDTRCV